MTVNFDNIYNGLRVFKHKGLNENELLLLLLFLHYTSPIKYKPSSIRKYQ